MLLGRNVEQVETTCRVQECQLWLSYLWSYLPFLFELDFASDLKLKYPSKYFDGTCLKCRTGQDDVSRTRMTTLAFLTIL